MIRRFKDRKNMLLDTALEMASSSNYAYVRKSDLRKDSGLSAGTVDYYFPSREALTCAIVKRAIELNNVVVLGQAIAAKHPATLGLSKKFKANILKQVIE